MIEHAGPELFRLDEVVRRALRAGNDRRVVTADPRARYFGAELQNDTLTPDEGAIIGVMRFDEWLKTSPFTRHATISSSELQELTSFDT